MASGTYAKQPQKQVEMHSKLEIFSGVGRPEGNLAANPGALYIDRNGGTGLTLYVKETPPDEMTGWGFAITPPPISGIIVGALTLPNNDRAITDSLFRDLEALGARAGQTIVDNSFQNQTIRLVDGPVVIVEFNPGMAFPNTGSFIIVPS